MQLYSYNYSNSMETIVATVRKWGNSKGVVLPKDVPVEVGEEVVLSIQPKKGFAKVRDLFGRAPLSGNTQKILDEVDRELDIDR